MKSVTEYHLKQFEKTLQDVRNRILLLQAEEAGILSIMDDLKKELEWHQDATEKESI